MKKLVIFAALIAALYVAATHHDPRPPDAVVESGTGSEPTHAGGSALEAAIESRSSGVQVQGEGRVEKILPDDNDGTRHQRFILRLAGRRTLLIAHNIDLAGRVEPLSEGDTVAFSGEYVWNSKGGVVHWTHRDPAGRHVDGWLEHNGSRVQ